MSGITCLMQRHIQKTCIFQESCPNFNIFYAVFKFQLASWPQTYCHSHTKFKNHRVIMTSVSNWNKSVIIIITRVQIINSSSTDKILNLTRNKNCWMKLLPFVSVQYNACCVIKNDKTDQRKESCRTTCFDTSMIFQCGVRLQNKRPKCCHDIDHIYGCFMQKRISH